MQRRQQTCDVPGGEHVGVHPGARRWLVLLVVLGALVGLRASEGVAHTIDLDCADFANRTAAQDHRELHPGDPDGLDDENGVTCPELPCPCGLTVLPPPAPVPVRRPPAPATPAPTIEARVAAVIDANTLTVRLPAGHMVDVRLLGIDPPKRRGPATQAACGAMQATARMKQLAFHNGVGRLVTLRADPTQAREDPLSRRLAYVGARGVDFGRALIWSGWARVAAADGDFLRASSYRRAQRSARAARRGAWRMCRSATVR
jgi:endonuclease YncB( thermonuclease family)